MEIFDRLKGTPQKVNSDSSKSKEGVRKNSAIAVGYAKSFEKEFDYSENSINDLEEILDYYSKNAAQSKLTEIQIWSMAPIFGSYLETVMLENSLSPKDYDWEKIALPAFRYWLRIQDHILHLLIRPIKDWQTAQRIMCARFRISPRKTRCWECNFEIVS